MLTTIKNLTDALHFFDLRDWMLLKSRKPGPRTKPLDLPTIPYGTLRTGKPYLNGMCLSYRFYRKDVEAIATIVHGDFKSHMEKKFEERFDRKWKRSRNARREMKIRKHTDALEKKFLKNRKGKAKKAYHEKRKMTIP